MTREDIIRMAREQGLPETEVEGVFMVNTDDLGRFAAAEREACAKVLDEMADYMESEMEPSESVAWVRSKAAAIRARGQA
jgi:hypothetical protein